MLGVRINFFAGKELNMRKEMMRRLWIVERTEAHRWVAGPVWKAGGKTYFHKKCKQGGRDTTGPAV